MPDSDPQYWLCVEVVVGAASLSNRERHPLFIWEVAQIIIHEQYRHNDFDIAILVLAAKENCHHCPE
jgi:hypothetical protein